MYKVLEPIIYLVKVKHFTTSDIYFVLVNFIGVFLNFAHINVDCYTDMTGNGRKAIMDYFCWSVGGRFSPARHYWEI